MKISREQAKQLGIPVAPAPHYQLGNSRQSRDRKIKTAVEKRSDAEVERLSREAAFGRLCDAHGLPVPVFEYPFAEAIGRKWRFDYIFDGWLAVEKVGGVWTNGHHSHGKDQIDDMEKANHAVMLGFSCLSFTPSQFASGEAFAFIKQVLDGGPEVGS